MLCQVFLHTSGRVYNLGMSYDIGTHVDLSRLNKNKGSSSAKMFQEAIINAYEVGTQITFQIKDGQTKAARRIPVAFA